MEGPLSFGSARDIARMLVSSREKEVLVIDLSDVPFIDSSASISLEEAMAALQRDNDVVLLCGLQPAVRETLDKIGMIESIPANRILGTRLDALRTAKQCLANNDN
jgi:SulP family sulfate permease